MDNRRKITVIEMSKDYLEENDGEGTKKKWNLTKEKILKKKKKKKTRATERSREKQTRARAFPLISLYPKNVYFKRE